MILEADEFKKLYLWQIESAKNYNGFEQVLSGAQDELEQDVQVFFEPRKVTDEKHDYFLQDFRQTFWLLQLHEWPLISVDQAQILYNDRLICDLKLDWLVVDQKMGTMELLPQAIGDGGFLFSMLLQGLSGFATIVCTGYERLPLFFHIDYTAGLNFQALPENEKNNIKMAIGRRAAINVLPKLDDRMGISAESTSQDGISQSVSYTASAMYGQYSAQIEQYKKDDEKWVEKFRRKHLKNLVMDIA